MARPDAPRRAWDIHAHLIPPSVLRHASRGDLGLGIEHGRLVAGAGSLPLGRLAEPEELIEELTRRGDDGAVISVPPLLYRHDLAGDDARRWAEVVNDGLLELVSRAPGRLRALMQVPLPDGRAAGEELARRDGSAFVGVAIGTTVAGRTLDDPVLVPFFEVANAGGWFLLIHPTDAPDGRLRDYYLDNLLGNPYETALAAARLIFSDMVSRFGSTKICLAHAGGAAPYLIGRWQRGQDTSRPGVKPLGLTPRRALGRLWFDTIVHDGNALSYLVRTVGPERLLMGSDWPFPMGDPDPHGTLGALPRGVRERILGPNVAAALDRRLTDDEVNSKA